MEPALAQRLAAAGAEIDRVCQMLLDPTVEQLDQSSGVLEVVAAEVAACREASRAAPPEAAACEQARRLAQSVRRARALLVGAAGFHAEWIRCLGALCAGYTDRGEPSAVSHASREWARG